MLRKKRQRTSAWVVDDFLDKTSDVSVTFRVIELSELGGALASSSMGLEDTSGTFSLGSNHSTHCLDF